MNSNSRLLCLCAATALATGCVTPMRASNRSYAPDEPASVLFPGSSDDALLWLSTAFKTAGFPVHVQYGRAPNTVYVFQRSRLERWASGGVYWGRKGRAPLWGSTITFGSVFYVYMTPDEDNQTYITLYGKPSVDGRELCGSDDRQWNLPCEDVEAAKDWDGRSLVDGSAEAAVVRELLADLTAHLADQAISMLVPTFLPPPTLPVPPADTRAACYWDYATGSRFQHKVCEGEEKSASQERMENQLRYGVTPQTRPGDLGNRPLDKLGE